MVQTPEYITKRDGSFAPFNADKIRNAIANAVLETRELTEADTDNVFEHTIDKVKEAARTTDLSVEMIQDKVEEALIELNFPKTAKAYILYRQSRIEGRKPDIFKKRVALKPSEYPHLLDFTSAIRESYWVHTDYNYTADVTNFDVDATEEERNVIKNAMLAIAQVEVAVKTFWGDIYHRMPKPEIGSVGYTFADSEVRHHDAYSHLLGKLRLNKEFEHIHSIPALNNRVEYLDKAVANAKAGENEDYALSIILFSLFVEHVSLFSQFLIIMSFNKHRNMFAGISNAIEATSKEEQLHGMFGIELIHIIRNENPEWFDKDLENQVYESCRNAYESEKDIVDWIYEKGDLDFMPKETVKEYIKHRLNNSLKSIGYDKIFDVSEQAMKDVLWFEEELDMSKHVDFFHKKDTAYTSHAKSVTADDLFG